MWIVRDIEPRDAKVRPDPSRGGADRRPPTAIETISSTSVKESSALTEQGAGEPRTLTTMVWMMLNAMVSQIYERRFRMGSEGTGWRW
jgi:hypothetical protein